MTAPDPVLDGRSRGQLRADILAALPGYVPELRPRPGTAGDAFVALLAGQLDVLRRGVDGLPARSRLSFLERLGNSQLPSQSARAPLTFTLLETSPQDVALPAGSQAAAKVTPPAASVLATEAAAPVTAPVFFTESTVTLMRGRLAAVYSVDPDSDTYADHSATADGGFTLFEPAAPMPHRMYLGHAGFLQLAGTAAIWLSFDFGGTVRTPGIQGEESRRPILLDWSYLSKDGWLPLELATDTTMRFTVDGTIHLLKDRGPDADEGEIGGYRSYWIRAEISPRHPSARIVTLSAPHRVEVESAGDLLVGDRLTVGGADDATITRIAGNKIDLSDDIEHLEPGQILTLRDSLPPLRPEGTDAAGALPTLDQVQLRVGFSKTDLPPDRALASTGPVELGNVFLPFGVQPKLYDTFAIACDDVFARGGARVSIEISKPLGHPAPTTPPTLSWEYSNGTAWVPFDSLDEFADSTDALTKDGEVSFQCPRDWKKSTLDGNEGYWLRARIVAGDYGAPLDLTVVPDGTSFKVQATPSTLKPPAILGLSLGYTYFTDPQLPEQCVAENDLMFTDHTEDCRWPHRTFEPFRPVDDRVPALHLGFSERPPSGLVSLFTAILHATDEAPGPSPFAWEYLSERGWLELGVLDETEGFTRSGVVQFVGAPDAIRRPGLGDGLYWYRARTKVGLERPSRTLDGLWLNTLWGRQGESAQDDRLAISTGEPDQVFVFPAGRAPVLAGERIEVEEWTGTGRAWETAIAGIARDDLRFDRDPASGEVIRVWVRWHERQHLFGSSPKDRHYLLERSRGQLRFGDGTHGRIPPAASAIRATYAVGGSLSGNVAAGQITELRTGVGFLQGVTNPLPALGGTATERLAATSRRAPQRIRHRGRAVSVEDYEWLALEASPEVARARCLATTGSSGRVERGQVLVIVVPSSLETRPTPSVELLMRVREHLLASLPAGLGRGLRVIGPTYAEVSVETDLTPQDAHEAAAVEERLRQRLGAFLHPLTGRSGDGWAMGEPVFLSQIAQLIEATDGVDHSTWARLRLDGAFVGDIARPGPTALLCSGDHQLKLSVEGRPDAPA